jgi:hypothetical protein
MSFQDQILGIIKNTDYSKHDAAASSILNQLTAYAPDNSYLVIVYDPVSGWDTHGLAAGSYVNSFRESGAGGKANVVVLWSDFSTRFGSNADFENLLQKKADSKMDTADLIATYKAIFNTLKDLPRDAIFTLFGIPAAKQELMGNVQALIDCMETKKLKDFVDQWSDGYNNTRALWICKRNEGVQSAYNKYADVTWVVGENYTIATLNSSPS